MLDQRLGFCDFKVGPASSNNLLTKLIRMITVGKRVLEVSSETDRFLSVHVPAQNRGYIPWGTPSPGRRMKNKWE